MKDDTSLLLEIIDKRIRKVLKEEHICYRYIAKVQGDNSVTYPINSRVPVTLMGFTANDDKYYFTNRVYVSHLNGKVTDTTLRGGDLVFIDAIGNNLNSGVITGVYKYYTDLYMA
jgi:hypothetical protein